LQPTVAATIHNGSSHDLSSVKFVARLYVDDKPEPVAESELFSNYNNDSGNSTGTPRRYHQDAVPHRLRLRRCQLENRGNPASEKTRAEVTVLPDSATDTGNRRILDDQAAKQSKPCKTH
jgi:hypothetical protein